MALDMLARLQSDGFIVPPSPTLNALSQKRKTRRRERSLGRGLTNGRETPTSPLSVSEVIEGDEGTPGSLDTVTGTGNFEEGSQSEFEFGR
jgi:cytokinesis protein